MIDLILRNATLSDHNAPVNLAIDRGRIIGLGEGLDYIAKQEIELAGRLVIPGFVESHLHLDIALTNSRERPGRNKPIRDIKQMNEAVELQRRSFTTDDIQSRAGQALELASRHGVVAMRAQCHVDLEVGLRHLEALLKVKDKYKDRVNLQVVVFPQQGLLSKKGTTDLVREAFLVGADVMGCASNLDTGVDFKEHIDSAFQLAMEFDVDLDIHADLGIPQSIELDDLEVVYTARRAMELGYQGRVTAGHVCALDSALPEVAQQAIELIREAQISVVSQPDLYRLGRMDEHHVRRGLTRVKELLAAGVNVTYASNNVRDGYRPLGNFDLLEEALILSYGAHMDSVSQLEMLLRMSTYSAAKALHLEGYGIEKGCQADLVVLDVKSPSAAIVNQAEKNYVFKAGVLKAKTSVRSEIIE